MRNILKKLMLGVSATSITVFLIASSAFAVSEPISLFGKDLFVKGSIQQNLDLRTHRDDRDVQISSNRSTFRIEGDYNVYDSVNLDVNFYTLINYWYDTGDSLDQNLRDAIRFEDAGSHALKETRRSNEQAEILKEFYLNFTTPTFVARIGKQIVTWGESADAIVADVINPLDVTNLKVFPDWEDLKIGLWMLRCFYTPKNMWSDLSFDFIFIPNDFQYTRLPPAGNGLFFGSDQSPNTGRILHKLRHDTPANTLQNAEFGLRIRGYTKRIDWTISHFYSRLDDGLIDREKGFDQLVNLLFGLPVTDKIYTYPFFHATAVTFSSDQPGIKSTIRGEMVLKQRDYQFGASKIRKKKLLTTAIAIDRKIFIPWLTPKNRMKFLGTRLTWYHYKLFGMINDQATGEFINWESGTRDSSWDKITLQLDYSFHYGDYQQFFNITYDCNGKTTLSGTFLYAPGDHWRYSVSYQQRNEQGDRGRLASQVMFNVRYHF
jgi:hypothetical protein